jgi:hypothetical protein
MEPTLETGADRENEPSVAGPLPNAQQLTMSVIPAGTRYQIAFLSGEIV